MDHFRGIKSTDKLVHELLCHCPYLLVGKRIALCPFTKITMMYLLHLVVSGKHLRTSLTSLSRGAPFAAGLASRSTRKFFPAFIHSLFAMVKGDTPWGLFVWCCIASGNAMVDFAGSSQGGGVLCNIFKLLQELFQPLFYYTAQLCTISVVKLYHTFFSLP